MILALLLVVSCFLACAADVMLLRGSVKVGTILYALNGPVVWKIFRIQGNLCWVVIAWQSVMLIVSVVVAVIFLGETVSLRKALACALTIAALIVLGEK